MNNRGFTLLELLITLTILILLMTIGVPSFSAQIHSSRLKTATLSLLETVALTRSKAVSTNKRATLKPHNQWEDGWEVFVDDNDNGIRDNEEILLVSHEKFADVRITPNQPLKKYISFIGSGESRYIGKSNGGAFQAGRFKVCPTTKGAGFELVLARSGRMRMDEISAAECAAK